MDREARKDKFHRVSKSRTQLKRLNKHISQVNFPLESLFITGSTYTEGKEVFSLYAL